MYRTAYIIIECDELELYGFGGVWVKTAWSDGIISLCRQQNKKIYGRILFFKKGELHEFLIYGQYPATRPFRYPEA
jgi:hypothetical protein